MLTALKAQTGGAQSAARVLQRASLRSKDGDISGIVQVRVLIDENERREAGEVREDAFCVV